MGEAKRRKAAALASSAFPGGRGRCPVCLSSRVMTAKTPATVQEFYGKELTVCGDCKAAWEPIDEALVWDRSEACASTSAPCDNCAFRPGSLEQRDTEKWKAMIASLQGGGSFYCHKGVPIDPEGEDGFKYQKGTPQRMRLCRGYLNALGKWWGAKKTTREEAQT